MVCFSPIVFNIENKQFIKILRGYELFTRVKCLLTNHLHGKAAACNSYKIYRVPSFYHVCVGV